MEEEQSLEDAILRMSYLGAGFAIGVCDALQIQLPREHVHLLALGGPAIIHGTLSGFFGLLSGTMSGYLYGKYYGRVVPTEKNEVVSPEELELEGKKKEDTVVPFTAREKAWMMVKQASLQSIISGGVGALYGFAFAAGGYLSARYVCAITEGIGSFLNHL